MRLTIEQLMSIGSLKLSNWLDGLNDEQLERYCGTLLEFIENFPDIEADFKKALFIGDHETLSGVLSELADILANIRADDLMQRCEEVRQSIDGADPEKLEADLIAFLSTVASLSVDIQMEQQKSVEAAAAGKPKTRKYPVIYADQQRRILAVDDIPVTLNILKATLEDAGYTFNGVTSAAAALDYITKFTPDLFILDIEMPKMNGFELAVKIREAGQEAPIIFLTGNTTRDYLMRAVKAGAADFLVKPVSAECVKSKIRKVFGEAG